MNDGNNNGAIDHLQDAHEVVGASTSKNSIRFLNHFNKFLYKYHVHPLAQTNTDTQ